MDNLREKGLRPGLSDSSPGACLPIPRPRHRAQRSANLREKGKLPASSDSSPGTLPIPRPRAQRSANSRKKGGHPASSDSSPGAFPIPRPPTHALPPAPEPKPIKFDEEECREDEEAAGAEAEWEGSIYGSNSHIAENIPATFEARAYAVEGQEDVREPVYITVYQSPPPPPPPPTEEPKKWYERPVSRGCMAISCFLVLLLIVGVVALVMYLPKSAAVAPPVTPEPTASPIYLRPEQIACNFLSISNVTKCQGRVSFDSFNNDGDRTTGSTIPSEIALLSRLMHLDVAKNSLTSKIPSEIGLMAQLTFLSFFGNTLTGEIPSQMGLLTRLTRLSFDKNQLGSSIPSEIGLLNQLTLLEVDSNEFTGTIPSQIAQLTELQALYFSNNRLGGTILSEIGALNQLAVLTFSDNQLGGTIPSQIAELTQLMWLYFDRNNLLGTIPSSLCSLSSIWIQIDCDNITCASGCCKSGVNPWPSCG